MSPSLVNVKFRWAVTEAGDPGAQIYIDLPV
jgi:hypothetical protein